MAKVSIGLRGWRFDESEVFTEDGEFRPMEEVPEEVRRRLARLPVLASSPCDACWLIHGDANLEECNPAAAVYGEPLSEVLVCSEHESDFLYWFREEDGSAFRGEDRLQDEFHEWFAAGGRAPEGYGGIDHVDTEPETVPSPTPPDPDDHALEPPDDADRIDVREMEITREYPTKET